MTSEYSSHRKNVQIKKFQDFLPLWCRAWIWLWPSRSSKFLLIILLLKIERVEINAFRFDPKQWPLKITSRSSTHCPRDAVIILKIRIVEKKSSSQKFWPWGEINFNFIFFFTVINYFDPGNRERGEVMILSNDIWRSV